MNAADTGAGQPAPFGDTSWQAYEPGAIHRALPVEWALGYLLGAWGMGEDMAECPLPGHTDKTPSFNLWAPNADGVPQRYGCFGCGLRGDVIDLVRMMRDVGFLAACRICVDELVPIMVEAQWEPERRATAKAWSPEVLEERLKSLRLTTPQDMTVLLAFANRKGMSSEEIKYAHEEWGVQAKSGPPHLTAFPHRRELGELTGIKMRTIDRRFNVLGSRFPALYGAWRNDRHDRVLLCEGETDTIHAAWRLRSLLIDVFGLPTGAAQLPQESHLELLRGRHVSIMFDADDAGRGATSRWVGALIEAGIKGSVRSLPEGEDLLSADPPLEEMFG